MSAKRDEQFASLKRELEFHADFIEGFLTKLKDGKLENNFLVFEFQSLMDGLVPTKAKADGLTRTLDHG